MKGIAVVTLVGAIACHPEAAQPVPPLASPQIEADAQPSTEPPTALTKEMILRGMSSVKPLVAKCYERFQESGMAVVTVVISPNGTIEQAAITGNLAGTNTGNCVEQAVRTARFPQHSGDAQVINYPFVVRSGLRY